MHLAHVQSSPGTSADFTCMTLIGVRARVLAVDKEMQRVSLGLKPSYFEGEEDDEQQELPDQAGDEAAAAECDDLDADVLEAVHGSYAEEDDWRAAAATADGACQHCLFFFLSRGFDRYMCIYQSQPQMPEECYLLRSGP